MQQKIAPKIDMISPPLSLSLSLFAVVWFLSAKLCAQNTLFSYNPVKNFKCVVNFIRWDSVVSIVCSPGIKSRLERLVSSPGRPDHTWGPHNLFMGTEVLFSPFG